MYRVLFFFLLVVSSQGLRAQQSDTILKTPVDTLNDYIVNYLEYYDIGFLWEGSVSQDERLGFIGRDYERIQIHFNSIIQNYDNPFEYFVYGKSKVKDNICEFQGSLVILETSYVKDDNHPDIQTAYIAGDFAFFEDASCLHSGIFRGEFVSFIYIGEDGTLYYNDIDSEQGSFSNNLFTGDWFQYNSDLVQPCNWGDKRIPGAGDLDIGLDSFNPSFRFLENGWKDYLEEKESDEVDEWWK